MAEKPVICLGMSCVDVLIRNIRSKNTVDEDKLSDGFTLALGGDALNQCKVLNKLEIPAKLVTTVGTDQFGGIMKNLLSESGLDTKYVTVTDQAPTSVSFVCIRKDGERNFIVLEKGTCNTFSPADVPANIFDEPDGVLCMGSIGGSEGFSGEDYRKLFSKAHENGYTVVADMVNNLGPERREEMLGALEGVDYLTPSRDEVVYYTGKEDLDEGAAVLKKCGVKNLVIKDGTRGSRIYAGEKAEIIPCFKVAAIDTTGAGDSFVGGFAAGLVKGMDLTEAVRFATAVSAITVQHIGAGEGIESTDQIAAFINSRS